MVIKSIRKLTRIRNNLRWIRNQSEKCLKHMTWSTLVKCGSMVVYIVIPLQLKLYNVTLLPLYPSQHCTAARTLNMKINHKVPKPDNIRHIPKKLFNSPFQEFGQRALWFGRDKSRQTTILKKSTTTLSLQNMFRSIIFSCKWYMTNLNFI